MSFKDEWNYICYEIRQRWEQLEVRKRINTNPRLIIGITCASVFVLLMIILELMQAKSLKIQDYKKEWFYDLNTGTLFVARSGQAPPIDAPSGLLPNGEPAGVRAYVFSYASEPNESNYFIGFLEIHDTQTKNDRPVPVKPVTGGAQQWAQGKLIRRVEDERWVPAGSSKGWAILQEIFLPNENGERASYYPPR